MAEIDDLLFGVRRSIRYHNRRIRWYDNLRKFSTFMTALSGSATIVVVLNQELNHLWAIIFSSLVAIFSLADLVMNTTGQARLHNDLARSFFNLEKEIITADDTSEAAIKRWIAKRLDIEANEPPPLRVLDCVCHNELMRAMGLPETNQVKISCLQRLLSPICDFRDHKIQPRP
jgi:hypothetical protein